MMVKAVVCFVVVQYCCVCEVRCLGYMVANHTSWIRLGSTKVASLVHPFHQQLSKRAAILCCMMCLYFHVKREIR